MASNAYTRGLEHARVLKNKSEDSDLFSHFINKYYNTTTSPEYNLEVKHFYTGDTTRQQVSEALMINIDKVPDQQTRRVPSMQNPETGGHGSVT